MTDAPRKRLPLRWLTLAEIVGVVALVLAALGYWDSHRERIQQDRERAAADRQQAVETRKAALKQVQLELLEPTDASGLPVWNRDEGLDLTGLPIWAPDN